MPGPVLPKDLMTVLTRLDDDGLERLLCDLLTPSEVDAIRERWEIVKLLRAGRSQREVRDLLGVGVATVSRGSRQLKYGHDGFTRAFSVLQGTDGDER